MPPPNRTPDQWADQCRKLPKGSSEPGQWRSARTPYMVPIMRACVDPRYHRVIAVIGSQMGKTEAFLNVIGCRFDDDPTPVIYLGPTKKLVESISANRVIPMFQSVPSLWEKLAKGKKNKITEKYISGLRLGFGWAGSGTEMSSHAAGLVLLDERDRMESLKAEGDPMELAEARISSYADGKVCVTSSPTLGNVKSEIRADTGLDHWSPMDGAGSPVWQLWQEGTRFEWSWPCPDCGEHFIPRHKNLKWPENATPQEAAKKAMLACPKCGALIPDHAKHGMNERGRFVAPGQHVENGVVVGPAPESEAASFWVSGLCSPWRSFGQRARAYVAAKQSGDTKRVQAVMNVQFGELYHVAADARQWQSVAALRGAYETGTIPEGVQVLTCSVDVQKNRLVYAIRGWGYNFESWLIEHGELWGETEFDSVWNELDELLDHDYSGRRMRLMLIDSGYKPGESQRNPDNQIYLFCRRHRGRVNPTKGHDTQDKPYRLSKIDVSFRGKIIKHGLDLWHLDTDYFKTWITSRLDWPADKVGRWHLNKDATDDYCKQIASEVRTVTESGAIKWEQVYKDNHYFDVETLNAAAAHILRLHVLKPLIKRMHKSEVTTADHKESPVPLQQQAAPVKKPFNPFPPPGGNWTTRYR